MNKLILCRHAETDTNARGVMHQTQDATGLNSVGISQAKRLGAVLRREGVEIIICSSEQRAMQTAEIAVAEMQIQVNPLASLHERNWGEWSGKPWSGIQSALSLMSLEDRYTFTPPSGESWQDFELRLKQVMAETQDLPYDSIGIVAHGGTLRALMPIIKGEPKETSFKYDFLNASVAIFTFDNGVSTEVVSNDISHLS